MNITGYIIKENGNKKYIIFLSQNSLQTKKGRRKANWIGHIFHRNYPLQHLPAEKIEGRIEEMGKWHKQPMDYLKEKTGYCKLKEEALYHTLWSTCIERGCEPVIRQTTE
jgi:hypothetical protein